MITSKQAAAPEKGCIFEPQNPLSARGFAAWVVRPLDAESGVYEVAPNSTSAQAQAMSITSVAPMLLESNGRWGMYLPEREEMFVISEDCYHRLRAYLASTTRLSGAAA